MNILKIRVQGQTAVWENPFEIVSGSQNYLYIKPSYGKDWDGLDVKFLFRDRSGNEVWNSETNTNVLDGTDGLIRIPASIISGPFFVVGVLGYGADDKFVPTASLKIDVTDNGYDAFSKVNGVSDEEKERLAELVLSDFKAVMDSYAETMAGYGETMAVYSANEEARNQAETERQDSENARTGAESVRQGKEGERILAEEARVSAEEDRVLSETTRRNAENQRTAYEDTRVINEQARVLSENDRRDAEDKRAIAESERENGEDQRAGAEVERLSAERERKEAETGRKTAEGARVSRENVRGEKEISRELAEEARVQAENERVTAESGRATRWQEMSSGVTKAMQDANDSVEDCEKRCEAAVSECGEAADDARNVTGLMANALKGSAIGQSVTLTDISPVEHTVDVKVKSKNFARITNYYNGRQVYSTLVDTTIIPLEVGKIYTVSWDTEVSDVRCWMTLYSATGADGKPLYRESISQSPNMQVCDGTRKFYTFKLIAQPPGLGGTVIQQSNDVVSDTPPISNFMVEEGEVATEYTPYVEDVSNVMVEISDENGRFDEVIPNQEGVLENVVSSYPSMSLLAMNSNTIVDVTYNRDINKAFAELEEKMTNAIISLGGMV